jgi:hypothetical protein
MAKRRRPTRAARRRAERQKANAAARERAAGATEAAEEDLPRVARHVDQLDHLLTRGAISQDMAKAGARFTRDYERSMTLSARLVGRYESDVIRPPKGQAPPDTPLTFAARERFEAAVHELGPLWRIVYHVAVTDQPPESWGVASGHRNGDAAALLRLGLATLGQHYGFSGARASRAGRSRHSSAARPAAAAASAPVP